MYFIKCKFSIKKIGMFISYLRDGEELGIMDNISKLPSLIKKKLSNYFVKYSKKKLQMSGVKKMNLSKRKANINFWEILIENKLRMY